MDSCGNIYFADSGKNAIYEWNASTQQVTTLVSTGLNSPQGVAVDRSGNVYIADSGNSAIKEWNASTQQVTTVVSTGSNEPESVAVGDSGDVYFVSTNGVEDWNPGTQIVTKLPFPPGASNALAVDHSGNVYSFNGVDGSINEWNTSTQQVTTLVSTGLNAPNSLAVDGSGNVYIADTNSAIKEWSASTQQVTILASNGLANPGAIAVDRFGNLYIADTGNAAIKELPFAFVGPANLTEAASAGSDTLLPDLSRHHLSHWNLRACQRSGLAIPRSR